MKTHGDGEVLIASTAKVAKSVRLLGRGRVVIGPYCVVEDHVLLDTGNNRNSTIKLGPRTKLKYGAVLRTYDGSVSIGARTSVGEYSILAGHGGLTLGSAVIVAGHCYFSAADHIFESNIPVRFQGETARGIEVEDGVWFGARCVVLDGTRVGNGAIVAAGSVVTSDLGAGMLCIGTPCKEIRPRGQNKPNNW